jgi:transcription initiation factor TFIIB
MTKENTQEKNRNENCPQCGGTHIILDERSGEKVCGNCGLVLTDTVIDLGPEYRIFSVEEGKDRRRVGSGYNINIYDKGLSTIIKGNRDSSGKLLDKNTQYKMMRLRRQDNRSKVDSTKSRNLSIAMTELDRLASELNLPENVKKNSAHLYRKALDKDLIRGRSIDAFIAACTYAACRLLKVPRPLKEVSKASKRLHSEVAMTYRLLHKELDLKPPVDGPYKFIPKIASSLNISPQTEQLAVKILRKADERNELVGKNPRGVAAAALYMACKEADEKRVQRVVSEAAGTTEVTLRNRMRGLNEALDELKVQPQDLVS